MLDGQRTWRRSLPALCEEVGEGKLEAEAGSLRRQIERREKKEDVTSICSREI